MDQNEAILLLTSATFYISCQGNEDKKTGTQQLDHCIVTNEYETVARAHFYPSSTK
jgi:hypothetical protein